MLRIGHDHSIVSDAGSIYQNVIYTRRLIHYYSFIYFRCLRSANATEYQFMHDIYAAIGDVSVAKRFSSERFRLPGSLSVGKIQAFFGSVTESTFIISGIITRDSYENWIHFTCAIQIVAASQRRFHVPWHRFHISHHFQKNALHTA